jgi:hypothetical protein
MSCPGAVRGTGCSSRGCRTFEAEADALDFRLWRRELRRWGLGSALGACLEGLGLQVIRFGFVFPYG